MYKIGKKIGLGDVLRMDPSEVRRSGGIKLRSDM